jgi:hypothetical protein
MRRNVRKMSRDNAQEYARVIRDNTRHLATKLGQGYEMIEEMS